MYYWGTDAAEGTAPPDHWEIHPGGVRVNRMLLYDGANGNPEPAGRGAFVSAFAVARVTADDDCIAVSSSMRQVLDLIRRLAASEVRTVLLQGETGVGKDVIANVLHHNSSRCGARFVAVNCAAIPETLCESELFGYERGAFTDARISKPGLLEAADRGTLFLDEIGQIPHWLQGKLLRVLEGGSFRRVGGLLDLHMNLHFVAATNLDLAAAVERGAFRMDLFYRLNVFQIPIPPLRERPDDILPLTQHFIGIYNRSFNRAIQGVSKDAAAALLRHSWPGNVRQLRNAVERAMVMEDSPLIELSSLPHEIGGLCLSSSCAGPEEDLSLARSEQRLMVRALEKAHGNQTLAAKMLGITRDGLRYKVRKHGLPTGRARAAGR
jgi:transcriptional regulator with PAS, ATPase and Fis domain